MVRPFASEAEELLVVEGDTSNTMIGLNINTIIIIIIIIVIVVI